MIYPPHTDTIYCEIFIRIFENNNILLTALSLKNTLFCSNYGWQLYNTLLQNWIDASHINNSGQLFLKVVIS